jgi:hypothetical protein
VIHVDPLFPERHRQFDIEYIERIKSGDYVRSGFHIRTQSSFHDCDTWEANMHYGGGFDDRAVLVKGPSRSSWFSNVQDYHRRGFCNETKDSHVSTANAIKKDEARQVQYWLLIFDEKVTLDNVIFSGDPVQVTKKKIALSEKIGDIDANTSIIFWTIAKRHGGFRRTAEKQESLSDMFN